MQSDLSGSSTRVFKVACPDSRDADFQQRHIHAACHVPGPICTHVRLHCSTSSAMATPAALGAMLWVILLPLHSSMCHIVVLFFFSSDMKEALPTTFSLCVHGLLMAQKCVGVENDLFSLTIMVIWTVHYIYIYMLIDVIYMCVYIYVHIAKH